MHSNYINIESKALTNEPAIYGDTADHFYGR